MKAHEAEIKRILSILAYLLKDSDPDGMELYFTDSDKYVKSKRPTRLVTICVSNQPQGLTDIRSGLGLILHKYSEDLRQMEVNFAKCSRLSILWTYMYFTNGIWQPKSDLDRPIMQLIPKLKDYGQYQVRIQFISFGSNPASPIAFGRSG